MITACMCVCACFDELCGNPLYGIKWHRAPRPLMRIVTVSFVQLTYSFAIQDKRTCIFKLKSDMTRCISFARISEFIIKDCVQ